MSYYRYEINHQDKIKRQFDEQNQYEWTEQRMGQPVATFHSQYYLYDHISSIVKMNCTICGKPIYCDVRSYHNGLKYCGSRCANTADIRAKSEAAKLLREKVCPVCGKEFTAARKDAKFCSRACKQKAFRKGIRVTAEEVTKETVAKAQILPIRTVSTGVFSFRIFHFHDEDWYDAEAVCKILRHDFYLATVAKFVGNHDRMDYFLKEEGKLYILINQKGLYSLMLMSRRPEVQQFRDMVVKKALIRPGKSGGATQYTDDEKLLADPDFAFRFLMDIADEEVSADEAPSGEKDK